MLMPELFVNLQNSAAIIPGSAGKTILPQIRHLFGSVPTSNRLRQARKGRAIQPENPSAYRLRSCASRSSSRTRTERGILSFCGSEFPLGLCLQEFSSGDIWFSGLLTSNGAVTVLRIPKYDGPGVEREVRSNWPSSFCPPSPTDHRGARSCYRCRASVPIHPPPRRLLTLHQRAPGFSLKARRAPFGNRLYTMPA